MLDYRLGGWGAKSQILDYVIYGWSLIQTLAADTDSVSAVKILNWTLSLGIDGKRVRKKDVVQCYASGKRN